MGYVWERASNLFVDTLKVNFKFSYYASDEEVCFDLIFKYHSFDHVWINVYNRYISPIYLQKFDLFSSEL